MRNIVKILSIDGGGIRGILPAMLLAELERRTGASIADSFDLIAGTSTGGILALALTVPDARGQARFTAKQLVGLYEQEGRNIFSRTWLHRIRALGNLQAEKYPPAGVTAALHKYLGDANLRQAVTDVLVTSYDIERRIPLFFKSSAARRRPDYDFPMLDVARATSAAPTYFAPMQLKNAKTAEQFALIDGGVVANNPAACALVEGYTQFPHADGYVVVSLGTGSLARSFSYSRAKNWGLAQWARPVLDIVFEGASTTVDYQLRQILSPDHYFRFQTALDSSVQSLDNACEENITALKCVGARLLREQDRNLDQLCVLLAKLREPMVTVLPRTG